MWDLQVLQAGGSDLEAGPDQGRQADGQQAPEPHQHSGSFSGGSEVDTERPAEVETTVVGPWMDAWPVTHTNRHVEAWLAGKRATAKA